MRLRLALKLHGLAVAHAVAAFGHNALARLQALFNQHSLGRGHAGRDGARVRHARLIHHIHIVPFGAGAHGGHGNQHAFALAQLQAHVHKLVRKKACALVAEAGLGARRTRGGVNLVVQRGKAPFGQDVRAGAVQRRHGQRLPGLLRGQHGGHVVLRHGKKHIHRMHLRERGQGRGAGNKVARVHRPQAHAARDGRSDVRVAQVDLRRLHGGGGGLRGRLQLLNLRGLRIQLLAGDGVLLPQRFIAPERHLRGLKLRLLLRALRLGLRQRLLERARVNAGEQIALFHHLPFFKQHLGQHARHLRRQRHASQRRGRAQRLHLHRQLALPRQRRAHRDPAAPAAARPARAKPLRGCLRASLRALHQPPAQRRQRGQQRQHPQRPQRPQRPPPAGRPCRGGGGFGQRG